MKRILLTTLFAVGVTLTNAADKPGNRGPLSFIENKGQVTDQNNRPRADIQFKVAAAPGLNIFIGDGEIHYQFCNSNANFKNQKTNFKNQRDKSQSAISNFQKTTMYRMDVELVGANKNAQVITDEQQGYYENYFNQNTGGHTVTAHAYNKITYKDIYPHIDWVLYINNGGLEHEFAVNEGGNVADIRLKYGGVTDLKLNGDGSLAATTPMGVITEQAPSSYEVDGKTVGSNFKVRANILSFETGNYEGKLVIDPFLDWATYFGGGNGAGGMVATDAANNVYMTGMTQATEGVATTGAYQDTLRALYGVFLVKFNSSGAMQWGTYYGGSYYFSGGEDDITTDDSGNIYITGYAYGDSGMATPGAYQDTLSGTGDAYLAKFNNAGAIQWATYYGRNGYTGGSGVRTDGSVDVYMTGWTNSTTGIATPGAYDTIEADSGAEGDAFLARFSRAGALQWATYFGGSETDNGYKVITDAAGNAYITGSTNSTTGIATPGAYQEIFGGHGPGPDSTGDAFLAKFNSTGDLQWATYYGGSGDEIGLAIAEDQSGYIYITGVTSSTSGIATPGAYQDTYGGVGLIPTTSSVEGDAFLAKFSYAGAIQWATYFGGAGDDFGEGVITDSSKNVYISGGTSSASGIATPGAYDASLDSSDYFDAYLAKFSSMGAIEWGTYYGGNGADIGEGLAIDNFQSIYMGGSTTSRTGIATPGAYLDTLVYYMECSFLAKFDGSGDVAVNTLTLPAQEINVYPNPATTFVNIKAQNPINQITISNVLGQTVYSNQNNSPQVQVDVSTLPPGLYFVKVNGSGVGKFVKD